MGIEEVTISTVEQWLAETGGVAYYRFGDEGLEMCYEPAEGFAPIDASAMRMAGLRGDLIVHLHGRGIDLASANGGGDLPDD